MNVDKLSNDNELFCPITLERFRDPVLATDGHIYERSAITRWIELHGTSPFTRQILHVADLCRDGRVRRQANQRRTSSVSISSSTETIELPSHPHLSRNRSNATVYPVRSGTIEHPMTRSCAYENRSWAAIFLMLILMGSILSISLLLFTIRNTLLKDSSSSCISSSKNITLLRLTNVTLLNYTYYAFLYTAMSSSDAIVFSFQHDSSYWCFDDLSMVNINSKVKLITNGGFESGVLNPFYFCSKDNDNPPNLLLTNSSQHSGAYAFCYSSAFHMDSLIQNLTTTTGQSYNVSFWVKNKGGPVNKLQVVIIA